MNRNCSIIWVMLLAMLVALPSFAQDEKTKSPLKLDLSYNHVNDDGPVIKVVAKTKVGKKFEPASGVEVSIFFMTDAKEGLVGKVRTNHQGKASLPLSDKIIPRLDSLSPFKFLVSTEANEKFDAASAEVELTRARIELTVTEGDSVRKISAKVLSLQDKKWAPVPQAEVKLVVKRLFQDFPIGESTYTTDENGVVGADFTLSIPGDEFGNLFIGAKIDDSEVYGSISSTQSAKWGIPTKPDDSFYKRTLWAARDKTPIWLLVFPNLIIATVWGFIFYLGVLIFRIRKIGTTK